MHPDFHRELARQRHAELVAVAKASRAARPRRPRTGLSWLAPLAWATALRPQAREPIVPCDASE